MKASKIKKIFIVTVGFFVLFFSLFNARGQAQATVAETQNIEEPWQKEIKEVNQQIEELRRMKIGYEGKATQLENKAQTLQFMQGQLQDSKRLWNAAESNRQIAKKIQNDIDTLEAKKKAILQEHNLIDKNP
jgi:glutaredoxin 2